MTNESEQNAGQSSDDWDLYLQAFLDESDEHLETLNQMLIRLEEQPDDRDALNEAFRLLHTHKGSAGLMGFEGISELAHELENRFDQLRAGKATLDQDRITAMLLCVDFLKAFNEGLRAGPTPDQDATQLLEQLERVEQKSAAAPSEPESPSLVAPTRLSSLHGGFRVRVDFEDGLQLADMKARLLVARLSNIGEIIATDPAIEDVQSFDDLTQFSLILLTQKERDEVEKIAYIDGVQTVSIEGSPTSGHGLQGQLLGREQSTADESTDGDDGGDTDFELAEPESEATATQEALHSKTVTDLKKTLVADLPIDPKSLKPSEPATSDEPTAPTREPAVLPASGNDRAAASETVRVGIDRLDKLMNLTGELLVTRARFEQLTDELGGVFGGRKNSQRSDDANERIRLSLGKLSTALASDDGQRGKCMSLLNDLSQDLTEIEQQWSTWEEGRRQFARISEAVDQLNRVSGNLQQSVLDTRMVPVGPLFNRFRRVIRDLAAERHKRVQLVIRGEKTELDKRMIDELGDPILHLVRNSLDHGLEGTDDRIQKGKPEVGTIVLEASHSGNNVFITISDDGSGLDVDRIRTRIVDRGLVSSPAAAEMTDQQVIDHIWQPGFSTAEKITDISGRGVGMDVVKNRISELNGSIEVETETDRGVVFKLRLPLTLAIISCLQVRFRDGMFSIPIDDVREIVAVEPDRVHHIHGRETIDVRGEFIPLIRMDQVFYWRESASGESAHRAPATAAERREVIRVVLLESSGQTVGLCVDELSGSADVVIKSLSDNFVNIPGLSGASIMGDGSVCLMLDIAVIIRIAGERANGANHSLAL